MKDTRYGNYICKSDTYKGVYKWKTEHGETVYKTRNLFDTPYYKTEREAAIAYDIVQINKGKKPVNILKKKP